MSPDADTSDMFGGSLPAAAAEQLADDTGRWPAQLAEMTDILQDELTLALPDLNADAVRIAAMRQIVRFCTEYGGTRPYIPKDDAIRRALRDLEIWARHDGTVEGPSGIRALGKRHNLSEVAVWSILREQRRLHIRRVQGDLFAAAGR